MRPSLTSSKTNCSPQLHRYLNLNLATPLDPQLPPPVTPTSVAPSFSTPPLLPISRTALTPSPMLALLPHIITHHQLWPAIVSGMVNENCRPLRLSRHYRCTHRPHPHLVTVAHPVQDPAHHIIEPINPKSPSLLLPDLAPHLQTPLANLHSPLLRPLVRDHHQHRRRNVY